MAGAPNDVSYRNNTHTLGYSIHYFPKDVAYGQNGRISIVDIGDILLFKVRVGLILHLGFENGCYKG